MAIEGEDDDCADEEEAAMAAVCEQAMVVLLVVVVNMVDDAFDWFGYVCTFVWEARLLVDWDEK